MWAMTACLTRLKPLIIYLVGSDILLASRIKKIITSKVLQSAELIFTNGLYLRKKALEIRPKAEIENLYLGIDIKKYSPSWDNSNYDQRNNTKLPNVIYNKFSDTANDEIRIICTRGFEYIYNNKYLIDGLKEISINDIQNLKIIFTSTGSLLAEIKAYADKILTLKQRKNIEFLGGVNEELLIRSLQSSQIYISLSRSDGASISLMEAYSCGLFPILSDIPANQEWINNDNGILVPLDKPVDLAKAIIRAVNDPILRRHAAKINREIVVQNASGIKNVKYFAEKVKIAIAEYNRII
jgi:glycosyltransferase involved in cell wall biosynthesis